MVLLDDSFATIVKAIERGRAVYNNIRRFLVYLFTHNIGELFPIVFATLAGLPGRAAQRAAGALDRPRQRRPPGAGPRRRGARARAAQAAAAAENRAPSVARLIGRFCPRAHPGDRRHRELLLRALRRRLALGRPAVELRPHLPPGDHHDPGRDRLLAGLQRLRRAHRSAQRVLDRDFSNRSPGRRPGPRRGHHARDRIRSSLAERVRHLALPAYDRAVPAAFGVVALLAEELRKLYVRRRTPDARMA